MRKALLTVCTFCLLATACQNTPPASSEASPAAPSPSASPLVATPTSAASPSPSPTASPSPSPTPTATPAGASTAADVDRYMAWFLAFVQKRADANTAANKRTKQVAEEHGIGSPELTRSLLETVTQNQQIAAQFQKEVPPAACAELARRYAAVLEKSITVMETKITGGSDAGSRLDLSTADAVHTEIGQVNQEIDRLYKKYPHLKTPKLILTL